jgi:hypothetical protein
VSSQHKAPLAAFLVVSIACIVVVVNALRSDALSGIFIRPTQAVVAGARLIPAPHDILSVEAEIVSRASGALSVTPSVVHRVVNEPVGAKAPAPHRKARHTAAAADPVTATQGNAATQGTAAAQASAPVIAPSSTGSVKHPAPSSHAPAVSSPAPALSAPSHVASSGKGKGLGLGHSGVKHDHGRGAHTQQHGPAVRPGKSASSSLSFGNYSYGFGPRGNGNSFGPRGNRGNNYANNYANNYGYGQRGGGYSSHGSAWRGHR